LSEKGKKPQGILRLMNVIMPCDDRILLTKYRDRPR
jgi:hypothetical protein